MSHAINHNPTSNTIAPLSEASTELLAASRARLDSIDLLRGLATVLMAFESYA
jgi:uncharacterized membrane protein